MKTNIKSSKSHVYRSSRLAGGYGAKEAKQSAEQDLRRSVMACMLWENVAYQSGNSVAEQIASLIPLVEPAVVASIAIESRTEQKLRHVPLFIVREMCRHESHRKLVRRTLSEVIRRPDEMSEFLSIYWKDGRCPIASQVKKGLADGFKKFDEYQLAKWNRNAEIKLRDVLFLCHPKAEAPEQQEVWDRLVNDNLSPPDTWETRLSSGADKYQAWVDLLENGKLGSLAILKNLRNMQEARVPTRIIASGIDNANPAMLVPLDFLKAQQHAPDCTDALERLMLKCCKEAPTLPGWTIFVIDVSRSMRHRLSERSNYTRMDGAIAMAIAAKESCENSLIYATAGSDGRRMHATHKIRNARGFVLHDKIVEAGLNLGGGGIFTRQCLEFIRADASDLDPDRIIIFSDSQDCDSPRSGQPKPFGKRNYIIDVSCNSYGVNYDGIWDAEISGWSSQFLNYIAFLEGQNQFN